MVEIWPDLSSYKGNNIDNKFFNAYTYMINGTVFCQYSVIFVWFYYEKLGN